MGSESVMCGHPISYWLELDRRFKNGYTLSSDRLIEEIATLRGRVSFYEARIREMAQVAGKEI